MTWSPSGKHFIAGERIGSPSTFSSDPVEGKPLAFSNGGVDEVDRACAAAENAFIPFAATSGAERAAFLAAIAEGIEARADEIARVGSAETGLSAARLEGELGRTTGQLLHFSAFVRAGHQLETRHDLALTDRVPPRPDLQLVHRPVGPVAVFGASNFPLAFSVAGGDTASALAAGCPVVVKGHPAHPATSEIIADAIDDAVVSCGLPPGIFSLLQGETREIGAALVTHPLITAVGFTGSLGAGRALFDLCAARTVPIPFFGELGSINPVFVLPAALKIRAKQLAQGWASSLAMGAGQFCTNPGAIVLPTGPAGDEFVSLAAQALENIAAQPMLTNGIANAYESAVNELSELHTVTKVLKSTNNARTVTPVVFETTAESWFQNSLLQEEVFGPMGLVIRVSDAETRQRFAQELEGQLTCTLHVEETDYSEAMSLLSVLERKAGRILFNGWPTGVEVAGSMVHDGPYPASTNFGHSSVGTIAIRRWMRPICYQDAPFEIRKNE